ncbi:OmpA family protein [Cereibacter changlensis]|uniref:OmpA family protein n=1 Tax=Cereibacter changlensis TaxID=402884 RepID=A0A4U0YPH2_9RHOB|nr:OmpA family protein [Cereibacter changlensis]TKA94310.1 OmpA family protein [Cereibacter changlensis]
MRHRLAALRRSLSACAGLAAFCALPTVLPAQPLTLAFPAPGAVTTARAEPLTSYRLPVGPWTPAGVTTRLTEGALEQNAWRIDAPGMTTLQLLDPLRDQLAAVGFKVIFACETDVCGGFDFRYGTDILPEPDMHVDLGDFRYLAAERATPEGPELLSLLVSRSATAGFAQLTRISPATTPPPAITASSKSPEAEVAATATASATAPATGLGARLDSGGAQPLEDLVFSSSAAALEEGDYASLAELAGYLQSKPERRVMLVGHTDASGSQEANLALSKQRAQSVRQRLIDRFGLAPDRIAADGVGALAPRASNLTEAGRTLNRRVEVTPALP